jgi:hypothetical protein
VFIPALRASSQMIGDTNGEVKDFSEKYAFSAWDRGRRRNH